MLCEQCKTNKSIVIKTIRYDKTIIRIRMCQKCGNHFKTTETIDEENAGNEPCTKQHKPCLTAP